MFVKSGNASSAIDALLCTGGKFSVVGDELPGELQGELEISYLNSETGMFLGHIDVPIAMFQPDTVTALRHFLELVEKDLGGKLFHAGSFQMGNTVGGDDTVTTGMADSRLGG